jgi:hypothetical protein
MSKSVYDIALDNAKALGKLQGAVMWTIRYGNLSDNDWKYLSRIYCEVAIDDDYRGNDIVWVREEAIRRGVDIGG